jgi:hypothetical protein
MTIELDTAHGRLRTVIFTPISMQREIRRPQSIPGKTRRAVRGLLINDRRISKDHARVNMKYGTDGNPVRCQRSLP